jgi:dephospho-CoA kinase
LKRYANDIFGVETGAKPRELYQWFGQTMRQRDPDVWVRKCFRNIAFASFEETPDGTVYFPPKRAVITDLRQPNEFDRCRSEGYVIIRVNASEGVRINRAVESADTFSLRDLTHDTESHVDTFAADYDVYNDGDMAGLYAQIEAIISAIHR